MKPSFSLVIVLASLGSAIPLPPESALAQGVQTDGPLTKNKLMKMLLLNDSSQQDLIKLITQNGVNFQPTPTEERDLHEAGGSDDLIVAVRANFREMPLRGWHSVTVPGAVSAWVELSARFGKLPFEKLFEPVNTT